MPKLRPAQVYDFTAFSQRTPTQPPPGDRLDAQFREHAECINAIVQKLDALAKPIDVDRLSQELIAKLGDVIEARFAKLALDAQTAAGSARADAQQAAQDRAKAAAAAGRAQLAQQAAESNIEAVDEHGRARLAELDAWAAPAARDPTPPNTPLEGPNELGPNAGGFYAGDVMGAVATSADYAQVSIEWAEHMPDTIPPNILAINAITGEHWSSRWWAHRAGEYVNGFLVGYYMGPFPTPPIATSTGAPIPLGSLYFNTASNAMYAWNGTAWVPFTTPQKAATTSQFYLAAAGQRIFPLTVADLFGNAIAGLDPSGDEGIEVWLNGVRLTPNDDFTIDYPTSSIVLPVGAPAGSILAVDVLMPPSQLAPGQVTINKLQPIVADGVQTTFPLINAGGAPVRVADAAQLLVILDGVSQEPGVDFIIDVNFTSIIFAQAPTADAKSFIVMLGNAFTLSGALVHDVSLIGDGTVTSPLGVAFSVLDTRYLLLSGGTMGGEIDLGGFTATGSGPPALPSDLTNKTYVDTLVASRAVFQGVYVIGANTPDLTNTAGNSAGYWWLAATVDPSFPDPLIIDLPGLPAGTLLNNGDNIIWNAALGVYQTLAGSSLTRVEADTLYLPFTGGVLTGPLILNADPVANLGAATKDYVDNRVGGAGYLPLAGGAMTGFLILVANPINPLDAATKQYVDTAQAAGGALIFMNRGFDAAGHNSTLPGTYYTQGGPSGAPPVGPGRFLYNAFTVTDANPPNGPITVQESFFFNAGFTQIVSRWVRSLNQGVWSPWLQVALTAPDLTPYALITYVNAQDALKLNLAGGAMTGGLLLNADPTAPLGAATKQYVDAQIITGGYLPLTGGAMSGGITFGSQAQGVNSDTSRHITLWGSGTVNFGFGVTGGRLNYQVSSAANSHVFMTAGVDKLTIGGSQVTSTVPATVPGLTTQNSIAAANALNGNPAITFNLGSGRNHWIAAWSDFGGAAGSGAEGLGVYVNDHNGGAFPANAVFCGGFNGQNGVNGQFVAPYGTAAAPSISFGNGPQNYAFSIDSGTGFYRPSANNIGVAVNGANVVGISSGGMSVSSDVGNTNFWNTSGYFQIQHSAGGAQATTNGQPGISFYSYNTPANGGLRKHIFVLNPTLDRLEARGGDGQGYVVAFGASAFTVLSDAATKQEINPLYFGARMFDQLQPVSFRRKSYRLEGEWITPPVEIGFVADDVEKAAPEAVQTDGDGLRGYSVSAVLAIAVAKIKQLEDKIEALEAKLA